MQTKEIFEQFLQLSALKEEDILDYRACTPFYAGLYIPNAITIQLKNNKEIIFVGNEESALRDKLLVGAGVIASELHAMGLISFPCGDDGEELSLKFIAAACDKYINEKIDISFDEYIESALRDEYGGVWKQLREE